MTDLTEAEPAAAGPEPEEPIRAPEPPSRGFGRMGPPVPGEKSEDFLGSTRRLLGTMRPERKGAVFGLLAAIGSVTLTVLGPRILGQGTDIIVAGITGRTNGIQFDKLRNVLIGVMALYVV